MLLWCCVYVQSEGFQLLSTLRGGVVGFATDNESLNKVMATAHRCLTIKLSKPFCVLSRKFWPGFFLLLLSLAQSRSYLSVDHCNGTYQLNCACCNFIGCHNDLLKLAFTLDNLISRVAGWRKSKQSLSRYWQIKTIYLNWRTRGGIWEYRQHNIALHCIEVN